MTRKSLKPLALSTLLLGGTALTLATSFALNNGENGTGTQNAPLHVQVDNSPLTRDVKEGNSFAPIVKKVAPSVVKIFVTMKAASGGSNPLANSDNDFFRRFFGEDGMKQMNPGKLHVPTEHGLGSGVIVSADGYILTNNHVVNNASEIQVALNDGRQFTAKVIGSDPKTDVALIRIKADNLPALTLADSDKIEVGDVVLAIGNPFGIGQTVTKGIVSAKDRTTSGDMDEDFIQTDAAINPGNSGGALVDTEGRVVGINSAILTHSGGNQGIGFAVPSNLCRWVMDSLVKNGRVDRGFMGVMIQNLTPDLATAFKLDRTNGALVGDVSPDSPADKAGLKSGDVITQLNGQPIEDASQLKLRVAESAPGSKVQLGVNRNGESKTFDVTLGNLPENKVAKADEQSGNAKTDALSGVGVADLDQNTRAELNIPAQVQGAVITEVAPDSAAYQAGLRTGDVITELDRKPVKNAQDAVADTEKPAGKQTLVKVWTKSGSHYLTVDESHES
ncbi:MAG: serine protease Do [Verrucomicrobiota bacterium]|jgi:serine protease Do|nr:serine protease Do [Verrucomicrobiota bacterium]MEA3162733.1 serine protease Do [Verrucomicrobiota bacterium]MEA3205694.1 serine protease Do [Verrucomicrobiota bacterium]